MVFSLAGAILILMSATDAARIYEARHWSNEGSRIKCRRLAAFDVRATQTDGSHTIIDAHEQIAVSPANGPERLETARVRITLAQSGNGWAFVKRESLDEQLASSDLNTILASPDLWTTQLSYALSRRAVRLINEARAEDGDRAAAVAQRIAESLGDTGALSQALSVRSILPRYIKRYELSIELAEEAERLATHTGDADLIAPALLRLGRSYAAVDFREATPFLRIIALADRLEDISTAGLAASQAAKYHDDRGEHRQAFHYTNLALQFAEKSGDYSARVSALLNLAGAYFGQGDFELAVEYWRRTAALARQAGFIETAAHSLRFAGSAESHRGKHDLALQMVDEAISLIQPGPSSAGNLAGLHLTRAEILLRAKRTKEALEAIAASIPLQGEHIHAAGLTAVAHLLNNEPEAAIAKVLSVAKPPERFLSRDNRIMLATAWKMMGRYDIATVMLRDVICESERERAEVTGDARQRWLFLENVISPYRQLLEILVEIGDGEGALAVVESIKARSLTESIADTRQQRPRLDQEQRIDAEIRRLNLALQAPNGNEEALRKQLAAARVALADVRARVRSGSVATAATTSPPPRARTTEPMLILSYAQTEKHFVLFAVQRDMEGDRLLAMHRMDAKEVRDATERVVQAVRQRNLRYDEYARPLYDLLIAPVERYVREAKMIGIIPEGELWRVPFQALPSRDNRYLIDHAPIFIAPSLSLLDQTPPRRKRVPSSVIAFAHKLPDTDKEARAVAALYDRTSSRVVSGADAREAVLKSEGDEYDVLHFATHGVADEAQPLFSYLLLAPDGDKDDGLLEAREIASLDLRAEVAVLSACSTAGGRVHAGEGIIGLSWAFLAAGCPRTVVSQWDAESAATATLMREFHRSLRTGHSTPAALRTAARALRGHAQYRHPFYWAPFVVVGAP